MTLTTSISVGDTLASRYRLDAPLGRGAMGEVFRGHDLELRRDVAVKLLAAVEIAEESRLMNEARAAAALNHPGLVAIYDVGRHGSAPFLVMELVPGADLRARAPRDLDGIMRMALQLLEALGHAHQHGIVHRDLKPANVLVADGGSAQYKLTDFGLALSRASSRVTHQGLIVGTAAYLAPEQALGRAVDGRADLYALGVMLYELVTGRLPFDGHDALTIVSQHVHAPVTPPRTFRSDVPPALERLIVRLLAKTPEERYATASETAEAIREVLAAISAADATATQAMPTASSTSVGTLEQLVRGRLIGREAELAQLRALWDRALQGQGHLALVSGEPGSGKTRLARELIVQAQVAGAVVLRGGCYEYEATTPYLPFVEALRLWVHAEPEPSLRELVGESAGELAKLAPELTERLGAVAASAPLPAHEERLRLFDHVARFFGRLAARRGLLFFADDLQWADQGTLALLHYLLRHLGTSRFLALGTYREIELDRRHPLAAALVDWNRERLATRIALGRLTGEETDRLLAVLLGQDSVSEEFGRAIFGETEGNPFFVEEVVKALIDQGQIYRGGGEWQRGDVAELAIPQSVKSAIGKRLDRLSETCADVLRTAATLGKLFEFDELAACAGVPENAVLDALDEALTAQLLLSEGRDFAFTHDKIREVLYEEMNPVRRRRLHQRIGEGLERHHAARLEANAQDLAHHFLESGDVERGLEYALIAAAAARKVFAFEEAVLFQQRARECADSLGRIDRLREIDIAIADSLDAAGRSGEAGAVLERVLEKSTDEAERVRLASQIARHYVSVGDPRAERFAEQALRDSSPDRHRAAFALASAARARVVHLRGRHHEAIELLTEAHRVVAGEAGTDLLAEIYGWLAGACQHLARLDESDEWARKLEEIGRRTGSASEEANGVEFQGENCCWRGHAQRALELSEAEIAIADRIHAADRRAWALFYRSIALCHLGRLAEAEATIRQSLDLCQRIGEQRLAAFDLSNLALILCRRGRFDEGDAALASAVRESERMKLSFVLTETCHAAAQKAVIQSDWERVIAEVARAREIRSHSDAKLNELEMVPLEVEALVELGRLDEARAKIAPTRALAESAPSDFYGGVMMRVEGLWLTRSGQHAAARAKLDEAIARLDRYELRYESAEAMRIRAGVRKALGDLAGAREDAETARRIFEECGAAPASEKAREQLASLDS